MLGNWQRKIFSNYRRRIVTVPRPLRATAGRLIGWRRGAVPTGPLGIQWSSWVSQWLSCKVKASPLIKFPVPGPHSPQTLQSLISPTPSPEALPPFTSFFSVCSSLWSTTSTKSVSVSFSWIVASGFCKCYQEFGEWQVGGSIYICISF